MSIETKKVVCEPTRETNLINHYTSFGWTLSHRDEVFSQTQHITGANTYGYIFDGDFTGSGTTIHSYTTTTNYVNLLFSRDTQKAHYGELSSLDQQCEKLFQELNDRQNTQVNSAIRASSKTSNHFLIILLVLVGLATAFLIIGGVAQVKALFVLGGIFAAGAFIMICPMFIREGTPRGFSTMSTGRPSQNRQQRAEPAPPARPAGSGACRNR